MKLFGWNLARKSIFDAELELPPVENPLVRSIKSFYDRHNQENFGTTTGSGFYNENDWRRISYILSRIDSGGSILDIGVGNGQFLSLLHLSQKFSNITGIDVRESTRFVKMIPEAEVLEMSVTRMTFDDKSYDSMTCMEVLEHFQDRTYRIALEQMRRVVNKQLLMTVPYCEPEPLPKYHKRRFVDETLLEQFPNATYTLLHRVGREGVPWVLIEERY